MSRPRRSPNPAPIDTDEQRALEFSDHSELVEMVVSVVEVPEGPESDQPVERDGEGAS